MIQRKRAAIDAEEQLQKIYGVSFADIGLTDEEWLERFGDQTAEEAVEEYGGKYDLVPVR